MTRFLFESPFKRLNIIIPYSGRARLWLGLVVLNCSVLHSIKLVKVTVPGMIDILRQTFICHERDRLAVANKISVIVTKQRIIFMVFDLSLNCLFMRKTRQSSLLLVSSDIVQSGSQVILTCMYTVSPGEYIDSIKWYLNSSECYRQGSTSSIH